METTNSQIHWNNCENNRFKITLMPGDKVVLEALKTTLFSFIKESVFIKKEFERLPQKGLLELDSEIIIEGNSVFF